MASVPGVKSFERGMRKTSKNWKNGEAACTDLDNDQNRGLLTANLADTIEYRIS